MEGRVSLFRSEGPSLSKGCRYTGQLLTESLLLPPNARWKDALVGCFKRGRYPHLIKTSKKEEGLSVYRLDITLLTSAVVQELDK